MASSNGQVAPAGSIRRTLRLLVALGAKDEQGLPELCDATGLAKATALRLLRTMEEEGFARQTSDGRWRLATLLWELGCSAVDFDQISIETVSALRTLVDTTGETAVYVVYDRGDVAYVEQIPSPHAVRTSISIGTRAPAASTATGHAILAHRPWSEVELLVGSDGILGGGDGMTVTQFRAELDEVVAQGYAFVRGGRWTNVWGVASAVFDRHGHAIAAVGVSGPSDRIPDDLTSAGGAVATAAQEISAARGGRPPVAAGDRRA